MDLNLTLFGEIITFIVLVWFTLKFVWPPLLKAMNERQQRIAEGLAAAERGNHSLELAREKITENLRETKLKVNAMIDKAREQGIAIVEDEKSRAKLEGERLLSLAKQDIEFEVMKSKEKGQQESTALAIIIAEKILKSKIDLATQNRMIEEFIDTSK